MEQASPISESGLCFESECPDREQGKGGSETELQFEAGFTVPGATYPFGMVQFTPTFFAPEKGFVVNQLSGAGCPNMGNFPVLPQAGEWRNSISQNQKTAAPSS